jgi:hypothetical protein
MAFYIGQATDYHDMLDQLKNLAKDDHINVAAVINGGTGYILGDTVTLAGGTKVHEPEILVRGVTSGDYITVAAVNAGGTGYNIGDSLVPATGTYSVVPELEVLTLSGSAVATILIKNPGVCSAQPSNPVATTSDGSGTGCEIDFTFTAGTGIINAVHIADAGVYSSQASNPVLQNTSSGAGTGAKFTVTYVDTAWEIMVDFEAEEATAAAVNAAGTGYTANDIVTVVGGTFPVAATVKVLTVGGSGEVLTLEVHTEAGEYSSTPANPAVVSGGTGSGLTLTMTWTAAADERKYLMLHNTVTDQYVGWKGFKETVPETAYVLQCAGFTGFNSSGTPWEQHPGSTVLYAANAGTYCPLSGGGSPATINYWINIQDLRIAAFFRIASVYPNFYVGSIDKYLTASEYAYPQLILGCTKATVPYNYSGVDYAGMNNPGAVGTTGPGFLRKPDGSLQLVKNWTLNQGIPLKFSTEINITPAGGVDYDGLPGYDWWYIGDNNWRTLFTESISISGSQYELLRISDEFVLVPCTLVSEEPVRRIYGDMIGVFTINPNSAVVPEDRIFVGTDVYRVFQNCNKTNRNFIFVIKED